LTLSPRQGLRNTWAPTIFVDNERCTADHRIICFYLQELVLVREKAWVSREIREVFNERQSRMLGNINDPLATSCRMPPTVSFFTAQSAQITVIADSP
jgi:hypothetical protein